MTATRVRISGFTLIEVLFTLAVAGTLAAIAVPLAGSTVEEIRTAAAARHVASRVAAARIDAVRRAATVALKFEEDGADYRFTSHLDLNGNGVRTAEIRRGVDATLTAAERLRDNYPGAVFGLLAGIPDLDGGQGNADGVRVGSSNILSLSPNGSATSGTLYVHGRRSQYAVRVFGATGRTRVFHYDTGANRWTSR
ncbi:MAG TPA: prepilin-type N-terminal cleavage/methylation domain-containing protein [Vicinamibacterales bacterium]|nr:prepilin-type N-terminal cleavage/methylation domain-containing protein [Vicinamibacterales bacterium]